MSWSQANAALSEVVADVEQRAATEAVNEPEPRFEAGPAQPDLSLQEAHIAIALTRVLGVLMRSPQHKFYALADLEWMVIPPVLLGQFSLLTATVEGAPTPVPVAYGSPGAFCRRH